MKNYFTLLLMAVLSVTAYAQEESEHLKFMGIEIDGPTYSFFEKLRAKGFTLDRNVGTVYILSGKFSGIDNCKVLMSSNSGIVYSVSALLPVRDDWSSLLSDYETFKEAIQKKYGVIPKECVEDFYPPYYRGCGNEYEAVLRNKSVYGSIFKVTNGTITIMIHSYDRNARVMIIYEDYLNGKMSDKNKENAILNDL